MPSRELAQGTSRELAQGPTQESVRHSTLAVLVAQRRLETKRPGQALEQAKQWVAPQPLAPSTLGQGFFFFQRLVGANLHECQFHKQSLMLGPAVLDVSFVQDVQTAHKEKQIGT